MAAKKTEASAASKRERLPLAPEDIAERAKKGWPGWWKGLEVDAVTQTCMTKCTGGEYNNKLLRRDIPLTYSGCDWYCRGLRLYTSCGEHVMDGGRGDDTPCNQFGYGDSYGPL
jgi:hypothetical protein